MQVTDYHRLLLEVKASFKNHFGGPLPDQVLNYWLNTKIREREKEWLERRFCTTSVPDLKGLAAACLMAPQASVEELNAYMGIPDGVDLSAPSTEDAKYAAAVEVARAKRAQANAEIKKEVQASLESARLKRKPGRPKKPLLTLTKPPAGSGEQ